MQLHPATLGCNGMVRYGNDLMVEASSIGFRKCERLYDDACDEGVVLRSPRTGNEVRWYHTASRMWSNGCSSPAPKAWHATATCGT